MKGIIIWEDNERATYCELINNAHSELTQYAPKTIMCSLKGESLEASKAVCSKDDTYDFETGALIALMKMCGSDKVVRACNEAFSYEKELIELRKDNNNLREANKGLQEEIKRLKGESEKRWKNYQRNIQKKQDRINELEAQIKVSEDDKLKNIEYYEKEIKRLNASICAKGVLNGKLLKDYNTAQSAYEVMVEKSTDLMDKVKKLEEENEKLKEYYEKEIKSLKGNIDELFESDKYSKSLVGKLSFEKHRLEEENEKLQHEYNLCLNSENALKCTVDLLNKSVDKLSHSIDGYKNDLYKVAKRCKELEEENEKLKLDCEKLQHGYNDMIFCGGRQNGKQYTFLVDLFKKLDQKKVDAAYKEAYNKWIAQPIWQKEVFKQIHKDQLASLLEAGKYLYKNLTKREKMWDDILKEGRTPVYVKREDIHEFLKECQATGIKWTTGKMPLETMPFHMSKGYDGIYFFVMTSLDISKSTSGSKEYRHVMCWWMTASDEEARNSIKYIHPMRWDLFKKGRIVVGVKNINELEEFRNKLEINTGIKDIPTCPTNLCLFYRFDKDNYKIILETIEKPNIAKINGHKVYYWEDVR